MFSIQEINLLQAQNEALINQNQSLQQEINAKNALIKELDDITENLMYDDTLKDQDGDIVRCFVCDEVSGNIIHQIVKKLKEGKKGDEIR